MGTNDNQVGGTHYKTAYQHWDFMARNFGAVWFKGCATKYVIRWREKNGVEDLKKAYHYLEKLEELAQTDVLKTPFVCARAGYFCEANGLNNKEKGPEGVIVKLIFGAETCVDIGLARQKILHLILEEEKERAGT